MLPLLGIVAELFPDIIKQLGAPLHEQSGSVQDQVLEAIKKATGLQNPETADPKTVKAEMTEASRECAAGEGSASISRWKT